MIGPTSETARAMMASLNGAMQKGMPADQAISYVKSQAMSGVAPLVDLYAMLMQFERMKQPQQQMPPQQTVKDQIEQMAAMQAGQNPMQQGLGGMNAGVMESPQFAGGGIIAFQQGGVPVNDPTQGMPYLASMYEGQREQFGGEDPSDFMRKDIERRRAMREEYDVGEGGEYQRAQQEEVDRMKGEIPGREREARKLDMAEFFFNIAAEASKPGATLLSSIAGAGPGYVKQTRASKKELDELQDKARLARMELLKANELERTGDITGAEALYTAGKQNMEQAGAKIAELTIGQREAEKDREFRASESEKDRKFRQELAKFEANARAAAAEVEAKIKAGTATSTDAAIARLYSRLSAATDVLNEAKPESEEYKTAMQEAANVKAQIENLLGYEKQRRQGETLIPPGAGAAGSKDTGGFTVLGSRPATP